MSVAAQINPITRHEFLHMFKTVTPPTGWSKTIAVANSGGPDSTCLLFLIHQCLTGEPNTRLGLPESVVSLSIDHDLQPASAAMSARCAQTAARIGAAHHTLRIPWSTRPYPPRPAPGTKFEEIARTARYHALFAEMVEHGTVALALGHHADDQVETALMRLARGSGARGAAGMRRVRRWGMGFGTGAGEMGWAGAEGLRRWLVRPLLGVGKDRILATCEAHRLEYVTDATNFQPALTARNAIRHMLSAGESLSPDQATSTKYDLSAFGHDMMEDAAKRLSLVSSRPVTAINKAELYEAVNSLSAQLDCIDSEVDIQLSKHRLPSPLGTFFLSAHDLSAITDPVLRTAVIRRIMRYVSPHPWGSREAEGNHRYTSLARIADNVWAPWAPHAAPFVAGGAVMWAPAILDARRVKFPAHIHQKYATAMATGQYGWIASRQPPARSRSTDVRDLMGIDVTRMLQPAARTPSDGETVELLFDRRFVLRFHTARIPTDVAESVIRGGTVRVKASGRFFIPEVVWRRRHSDAEGSILAKVDPANGNALIDKDNAPDYSQRWIQIAWIRPLEAL